MSIKKKVFVDDFDRSAQIYYQEIANSTPLTRLEEQRLWRKYKKNNDLNARNKLIESNLKFVANIAKAYRGRGLSYSELVAEGNYGLIKALKKFKAEKGNKLISYSVWWIRQSILEAIEKRNKNNTEDYPQDYEEPLISDETNEKVVEPSYIYTDGQADKEERASTVLDLVRVLNDKEKEIVSRYYGLNGGETETLEEIGADLGLTKERIRQINEKALTKMRAAAYNNSALITIYN